MRKDRKTILMTTDTLGGVWTYSVNLTRELSARNFTIHLATMGKKLSPWQQQEIADIENLVVHESEYKLEWMAEPWEDIEQSGNWLRKLEGQIKPDLIHLNTLVHGGIGFTAPVITVCHSDVFSWYSDVKGELPDARWNTYKAKVSRSLDASDLVVGISQYVIQQVNRFYGPIQNMVLIYNGLDPRSYHFNKVKSPVLFSMGRIWDEAKNFELVGKIAGEIGWCVEIAGNNRNPDTNKPVYLPHINFPGQLPQKEVKRKLAEAAVFVLPAKYEPFGLTALEAAFSGCALLLSNIPSLKEIWQNNAMYFNPEDPADLKKKFTELQENIYLRKEMGRLARKQAGRFTLQASVDEYIKVYDKLLIQQLEQTA